MVIIYTLLGSLWLAGKVKAALASSKMRLFQSTLSPDENTVSADLVDAEADYDGYTEKTITAYLDAYFDPAGGSTIQSGTQQFEYVDSTTHVHNDIGGAWIEDSTGAVIAVVVFPHAVSMARDGDAIPIDLALNYGRNG